MTADYIAFHAAERPGAVAVIDDGREITYADLCRDIRKFKHALRALGLPWGSKAAIDCENAYFNLLMRLAFEQLRVVTAMVELRDNASSLKLAQDFDVVLSGRSSAVGADRHLRTTIDWLRGVLVSGEEDQEPAPEKHPDDPIRIVVTSGTTGMPKRLLYTRRIHEAHIASVLWLSGFTRRSRYLMAMPGALSGAAGIIRAGGTLVLEERTSIAEAIRVHGITHTTLPPFALKRILDELPEDFAKPADLMIWSFGSPISHALREKASNRLTADLCDIYASNEANNVSIIRGRSEIGTIWPGVQVEVVDEHDRPLPFGQPGRIRVRTDCMVTGYMDFPEAAGRIFKDGWFYAGDAGILHDTQRLQVIGRSDDVINIGWNKFSPDLLENLVLKSAEVGDVGVCSVPNSDGIEEAVVAVSSPRCSAEELLERLTHAFRDIEIGRFHILNLARIPRNANGKIQRNFLKEAAAKVIRAK